MRKNPDFIGDDDINWSSHARKQAKKGNYFTITKAFDYFSDLVPKHARCLDAGCNIGRWAQLFTNSGWLYMGVDASKEAIDIASKNLPNYRFAVSKLEDLDKWVIGEFFDLVFTNSVLQHIHNENKEKILKNFHFILKKDGLLVLQESNISSSRTFTREGWILFVEPFGFKYITGTPEGDNRNGMVFKKK